MNWLGGEKDDGDLPTWKNFSGTHPGKIRKDRGLIYHVGFFLAAVIWPLPDWFMHCDWLVSISKNLKEWLHN